LGIIELVIIIALEKYHRQSWLKISPAMTQSPSFILSKACKETKYPINRGYEESYKRNAANHFILFYLKINIEDKLSLLFAVSQYLICIIINHQTAVEYTIIQNSFLI
jgi:hypothetical protein